MTREVRQQRFIPRHPPTPPGSQTTKDTHMRSTHITWKSSNNKFLPGSPPTPPGNQTTTESIIKWYTEFVVDTFTNWRSTNGIFHAICCIFNSALLVLKINITLQRVAELDAIQYFCYVIWVIRPKITRRRWAHDAPASSLYCMLD